MPQVTSSEYSIADAGTYMTTLCEIESKSTKQKSANGEERDSTFWVWKFSGFLAKDKRKVKIAVEIITGTGISSKDSALKRLLMSAFPEKSVDDLKSFNTDEMIGKTWVLKVGVTEANNGNDKNVVLNIEASDEDLFED